MRNARNKAVGQQRDNQNCEKGQNPAFMLRFYPQTLKSFYKLATFNVATPHTKQNIMVGKRKLSNEDKNLAGNIPSHIVITNGLYM